MSKNEPNALISIDNHFIVLPNGELKCEAIIDSSFWNRYLDYFNSITVLVRAEKVQDTKEYEFYNSVAHPGVTIVPVPMFKSISDLIKNRKLISSTIKETINGDNYDNCIIRLPSLLGYFLFFEAKTKGIPLVGEVVADMSITPKDSGVSTKIKTKIFHWLLKYTVKRLDGVAYVTKDALQEKYPTKKGAFVTNYSSIDLKQDYFYKRDEISIDKLDRKFKFIHVSTLNSNAKGHKIFIDTLVRLNREGYRVEGVIVGGGYYKDHYASYVNELDANEFISFSGTISDPSKLRDLYIESDILLFPTEFEGLPRTVIEAMAVSLPVVASAVGGIPELIESALIGDSSDTDFFYEKAKELITNSDFYNTEANRNYLKAFDYESSVLQKRRSDFFKKTTRGEI